MTKIVITEFLEPEADSERDRDQSHEGNDVFGETEHTWIELDHV